MKTGKNILFLALSLILAGADQLSKWWIQRIIGTKGSIPIIQGVFHLTRVQNSGSIFGLMKGANLPLIILSIIVATVIIYMMLAEKISQDWLTRAAVVLLLAGTLGNLIDRLRHGAVFDFLDFQVWPVFNLADMMITSGVVALLIKEFRTPQDPQDPSNAHSP